jgi:hypothetical protein
MIKEQRTTKTLLFNSFYLVNTILRETFVPFFEKKYATRKGEISFAQSEEAKARTFSRPQKAKE